MRSVLAGRTRDDALDSSRLSEERKLLIDRYIRGVPEPELEVEVEPEPEPTVSPPARSLAATPGTDERPRRGRPPGRAKRRQVHFHVDAEQDRLLLAAARMFGSQQKGLVAALRALQEVVRLQEQVDLLREECERQSRLLEEAEALFRSTRRATDT